METHRRLEITREATAATLATAAAALLFYPPCPIRLLTGWLCPGCGATHALAALLFAHWSEAWRDNPLVIALVPLVAAAAYKRSIPRSAVILTLIAAVLFGILRNTYFVSFVSSR